MALKAETLHHHHIICMHMLFLARSPVCVCSLKQENVQNCNYREFIWTKITSQNFFHPKWRKVSLPPLKNKSKLKVRGFRTQVLSFSLLYRSVNGALCFADESQSTRYFCHVFLTTENAIASQEGFGGASKEAENLQGLGTKTWF